MIMYFPKGFFNYRGVGTECKKVKAGQRKKLTFWQIKLYYAIYKLL